MNNYEQLVQLFAALHRVHSISLKRVGENELFFFVRESGTLKCHFFQEKNMAYQSIFFDHL